MILGVLYSRPDVLCRYTLSQLRDRVEIPAGRDAVGRRDRSDRLSQSVAGPAKRLFLAHFSSDYPEISATGPGSWKQFGSRDYPERWFYLRGVVFLVRKKG